MDLFRYILIIKINRLTEFKTLKIEASKEQLKLLLEKKHNQ